MREQRLTNASKTSSPSHTPKPELYRNSPAVERVKDSDRNAGHRSRSPPKVSEERRKHDSAFDLHGGNHVNKSDVKVKEERKDEHDDIRVVATTSNAEPRPAHMNDYLSRFQMGMQPQFGLSPLALDRARMMSASFSMPGDPRLPRSPMMWDSIRDPYRSALDFQQHRMDFQRELEREQMLHRLHNSSNPLGSMIDHERFRDRDLPGFDRERREMEARREMDRIVQLERERERVELERTRMPHLRPTENNIESRYASAALGAMYPHLSSASPLTNHNSGGSLPRSKNNSPSSNPGAPPPLIPTNGTQSHGNSPVVNSKGSPLVVENTSHEHLKKESVKQNDVGAQNG